MCTATLYFPDTDPIGPPSGIAVIVCFAAWATIRYAPMARAVRYRLIALTPFVLCVIGATVLLPGRFHDASDWVATIVTNMFALGFAMHATRIGYWLCRLFGIVCFIWLSPWVVVALTLQAASLVGADGADYGLLAMLLGLLAWVAWFIIQLHLPTHLYPRYRWQSLWRRHKRSLRFGRRAQRRGVGSSRAAAAVSSQGREPLERAV